MSTSTRSWSVLAANINNSTFDVDHKISTTFVSSNLTSVAPWAQFWRDVHQLHIVFKQNAWIRSICAYSMDSFLLHEGEMKISLSYTSHTLFLKQWNIYNLSNTHAPWNLEPLSSLKHLKWGALCFSRALLLQEVGKGTPSKEAYSP